MIVFEVTDLDGYWSELEAKDLPSTFPGEAVAGQPNSWREIHIIDPGGVCWHVRQAEA